MHRSSQVGCSALASDSSFLSVCMYPGTHQQWFKCSDSCPQEGPRLNSGLLASARPSRDCCWHLGTEQTTSFLSNPLFSGDRAASAPSQWPRLPPQGPPSHPPGAAHHRHTREVPGSLCLGAFVLSGGHLVRSPEPGRQDG